MWSERGQAVLSLSICPESRKHESAERIGSEPLQKCHQPGSTGEVLETEAAGQSVGTVPFNPSNGSTAKIAESVAVSVSRITDECVRARCFDAEGSFWALSGLCAVLRRLVHCTPTAPSHARGKEEENSFPIAPTCSIEPLKHVISFSWTRAWLRVAFRFGCRTFSWLKVQVHE